MTRMLIGTTRLASSRRLSLVLKWIWSNLKFPNSRPRAHRSLKKKWESKTVSSFNSTEALKRTAWSDRTLSYTNLSRTRATSTWRPQVRFWAARTPWTKTKGCRCYNRTKFICCSSPSPMRAPRTWTKWSLAKQMARSTRLQLSKRVRPATSIRLMCKERTSWLDKERPCSTTIAIGATAKVVSPITADTLNTRVITSFQTWIRIFLIMEETSIM